MLVGYALRIGYSFVTYNIGLYIMTILVRHHNTSHSTQRRAELTASSYYSRHVCSSHKITSSYRG